MSALCPHCSQALSTYTTRVKSEPADIEVLVCAHCDKVLGVVGRAVETGRRRMDVDEIADVLGAALSADDPDQVRTLRSIAIDQIDSQFGNSGGDDSAVFERIFTRLLEQHQRQRREEQWAKRQRDRERERPD
jgi:hypothetical protein